jgi:hypothetical protein
MKYQKKCECCGHIMTAYTHKLWKQQIEMLWKLIWFHLKTWRPAIISELWLTPVQYSIFAKMQYFDLIVQQLFEVPDKKMEKLCKKIGRVPTPMWYAFYTWKCPVYSRVATMNWKRLSDCHEAWDTDKEKRKMVYRRDIENEKSKTHEEYKNEKRKFRLRNLFE